MKLAKLSLVAVVAVGALTSFASATKLEEAIKGVELKGYVRYRHTVDIENETNDNEYKGVFGFTMPVNDMVKANVTLLTIGHTKDAQDGGAGDGNPTINTKYANFAFTPISGLTVVAGKQKVVTPFADPADDVGTGVIAVISMVKNFNLYAGYYLNTNIDKAGGTPEVRSLDIYAFGADANLGIVSGSFWYADVQNFATAWYVDAKAKIAMVSLSGAYAALDPEANDDDIYQARIVASVTPVDMITASLGYVVTGEDGGDVTLGDEDAKSNFYIELADPRGLKDASLIYAAATVSPLKTFSAKLEYLNGDATGVDDVTETKVTGNYKMSKNFNIQAWYSTATIEPTGAKDIDMEKARLEMKYTF